LSRFGFAIFYAGADFIGSLFMAGVGVLFAWRWYTAGFLLLVATCMCIAFSMVTIFGFQSSNRTAVTINYEAKQKQADKRLDWLRGLTVDKNLTRDRMPYLRRSAINTGPCRRPRRTLTHRPASSRRCWGSAKTPPSAAST